MKDAQKPDHVSLNTLIGRLREGRFVIPDFQREFEWQPWDIRDLMRSIFLDYYIESLLLWKGTCFLMASLSRNTNAEARCVTVNMVSLFPNYTRCQPSIAKEKQL